MYSRHDKEFDKLNKVYFEQRTRLLSKAAVMAVTFFKENFRRQGFLDRTVEPWEKRSTDAPNANKPRGIVRGILRRSIMKKSVNGSRAVVGVDQSIRYAEIQNNGGKIPITNKMRRFFWAMYYKYAGQVTYNVKTREMHDTKRNQAISSQANFWKALALTKETHITIKPMKFIGDSWALEQDITKTFEDELFKMFTK